MANQSDRRAELDGRRAISVPQAARLYDMTKNTMRKILKQAGVLIEKGKVHRVLWDDLLRVMEGGISRSPTTRPENSPVVVSSTDRAAFARAARKPRRT